MKRFFMGVKSSVSPSVFQTARFGILMLVIVTLTAACESNNTSTDEAQTHVSKGNEKLERMEQIDTELRSAGISIKHPSLSTYVIANKPEPQLLEWRKIVHEYIANAETVLKIADRPDVAFGEKQKISDWLIGANRLLGMIESEIGNLRQPRSELDAKFWSDWSGCRKWTENRSNRVLYGIEFFPMDNQISVRAESVVSYYARLGREKRRKIKLTALRHLECLAIEKRYSRHFEPDQNVKDENSRISRIEKQRKHIETIVESLSVSPTM